MIKNQGSISPDNSSYWRLCMSILWAGSTDAMFLLLVILQTEDELGAVGHPRNIH